MESIVGLLPIFLILAVFWLLILRPARSRQRAVVEVQSALAPGAEVITTAGLYARVVAIEGDVVVLEVAPGVTNRYARQAVVRVVSPVEGADGVADSDGAAPRSEAAPAPAPDVPSQPKGETGPTS